MQYARENDTNFPIILAQNKTRILTEPWWLSGLVHYKSGALSNAQGPDQILLRQQIYQIMTDFSVRRFASILIDCIGDSCTKLIPGN